MHEGFHHACMSKTRPAAHSFESQTILCLEIGILYLTFILAFPSSTNKTKSVVEYSLFSFTQLTLTLNPTLRIIISPNQKTWLWIWAKILKTCWLFSMNGKAVTYLTIVLTIQGLCPSRGTASSMSGWVLMKFKTSSGNEVEELNLEPWPAQPPGLRTRKNIIAFINVERPAS